MELTRFRILFAGLFIAAMGYNMRAQAQEQVHDHEHHHHHHKNEIGVANSPVYFIEEEELSYGLHMHYVRHLGHTKFGVGLGYERIFDEHKHTTVGLVGSYRATDEWSLIASPGIAFEADEGQGVFALHLETTYEFEIGNVHLGPVLEYAYDTNDQHISLGLHIGYGF